MVAPAQVDGSVRTLLQAYELVGALVGLFIAYIAFQGYRRNDSRPMLYMAVGFGIIVGLPLPLVVVSLFTGAVSRGAAQAVIQTLELVGLACILYALRMEP